jgi:hypothetical protein
LRRGLANNRIAVAHMSDGRLDIWALACTLVVDCPLGDLKRPHENSTRKQSTWLLVRSQVLDVIQ